MMQRTNAQWSALLLLEFGAQMWCLTGLLLPMADMMQMGPAALQNTRRPAAATAALVVQPSLQLSIFLASLTTTHVRRGIVGMEQVKLIFTYGITH
jgi:hypothetical protein